PTLNILLSRTPTPQPLPSFPTRRSSDLLVSTANRSHDQHPQGGSAVERTKHEITSPVTTSTLAEQEAMHDILGQDEIVVTVIKGDRKSTRLNPVTVRSRMPSSA